jgi:protease I
VVSPEAGAIQAFTHDKPGETLPIDVALKNAKPEEFDTLVLPGGVAKLRHQPSIALL